MSAEVAETLRKAKAVLAKRGWIRHKRFDEKQEFAALDVADADGGPWT